VRFELLDPYSPRASPIWQALTCRSYFLTWGWVENWLACLPPARAPRLGVFHAGDRVAAAGMFARGFAVRNRIIASRAYHLNTLGIGRFDELWIEDNGLVGDELPITAVADALPGRWDELVLPGLREHAFGGLRDGTHDRYRVRVDRRVPAYFVDLEAVRRTGYLASVSGQTRSQIRRARKLAGSVTVEVAANERHAIEIYDELTALHGAQWRAKGKPGAFADPWFDRFHRRLIATRFGAGEIQLVRVRASGATLGCLYNFLWQGRVLQYQSGLCTSDDPRMKPGFVCHSATIEHCAAGGLAVYDLLGGAMRYKKSLSTGTGWLVWGKVQRRRLRFVLEDHIVRIVRARERTAETAADAGA
jgi:hypothetical protein